MIVNTSGGPEFASSVRQPHLTSDAVALLRDNVTPRENELWTSLGDSWTRPGLELPPEEGPPYRPEFFSGWEPPVTDPQGRAWEDPVEKQLQHERRRRQVRLRLSGEQPTPPSDTAGPRLGSPGWGRGRSAWPRLTRLSYFLQQSAPQVAVNGHQDLEPESEPQLESETAGKWVLCNYDFQARNSSELSVKQRDVLEVLDDRRKWWKVRDPAGQEGYVPYNILTPHPGPRLHHCQSSARSLNSTPPPPPAPAPAPPPALARPRWDSCDSLNSLDSSEKEKFSQMLIVNEELQARLAQGRSGPSRAVPGPRAPEPQLSPQSDASEVRAWLQAKGFSSGTVDALGVLTGAQLFSLQKEELRAVSPEEGARVYSQVTVQRALLEDKEKVSELEAVMEKQKKKVEGGMEMEVI
uniref:SH3 domain-containing protein n=1 Tax=Macaca mulatta TaxID=9544 RepID=A0A5F8AKZ2_MACMU